MRLSKVSRFISGDAEQINYLPKQFTETNLGNSGRLDQTRVLSGFPISKEFDFARFNKLKFNKQAFADGTHELIAFLQYLLLPQRASIKRASKAAY